MRPLALAAAAAAGAALLAGCGSSTGSRRHALNEYVGAVNKAEQASAKQWNAAAAAYRSLGRTTPSAKELKKLKAASKAIAATRRRIAALDPPPDARRLHARLLHLFDLDEQLAGEVALFGSYAPQAAVLTAQVNAATQALRPALAKPERQGQRRALAQYRKRLQAVSARLAKLRPPPALKPWHAEQRKRLRVLLQGTTELEHGLAARSAPLLNKGVETFQKAAAAPDVTKADRAAIVGYNRRLRRIATQMASIVREEQRLAVALNG